MMKLPVSLKKRELSQNQSQSQTETKPVPRSEAIPRAWWLVPGLIENDTDAFRGHIWHNRSRWSDGEAGGWEIKSK